jgi:methylenetetrahydrofolate reductase (NADPH)
VDAGADYVCTQLFFDNRDFYDFCERCEIARIGVPIIAGIMPVTSLKGMQRMAELALGARFPARLIKSLVRAKDDEYVERVGTHWATEQVRDLIDHGVKGVHFYTLNRSRPLCRSTRRSASRTRRSQSASHVLRRSPSRPRPICPATVRQRCRLSSREPAVRWRWT